MMLCYLFLLETREMHNLSVQLASSSVATKLKLPHYRKLTLHKKARFFLKKCVYLVRVNFIARLFHHPN